MISNCGDLGLWVVEWIAKDIMNIHTRPVSDLIDHELAEDCPCGPSVEAVKRGDGSVGWHVIHHSLDGRERWE